jgi:hypothetical protein
MDAMGDKFPLEDHIWDFDKFKNFLMTSMGFTERTVEHYFVHNMKRLFLATFRASKDVLPQKNGYWLLSGLDIAVDENLNIYVLEVNTNPSIHYDTKVWGPKIVETTYKMLGEVLELTMHAQAMTKLGRRTKDTDLVQATRNGWHLIYSDAVTPEFEYDVAYCYTQDERKHSDLQKRPKSKDDEDDDDE